MLTQTRNTSNLNALKLNHRFYDDCFCYAQIFQEIINRFKLMTLKHGKIYFMLFNVFFPNGYENNDRNDPDGSNKEISEFFRNLKEDVYNHGVDLQYVWIREQYSANSRHHYHCMVLFNAEILQKKYPLDEKISLLWARVLEHKRDELVCIQDQYGFYSPMHRPKHSRAAGSAFDKPEVEFDVAYSKCIAWASYISKVNHNSQTPFGIRRFGVSRISHQDFVNYMGDANTGN